MIVRSESILAMLPPAIALSWVIVDAAMGLVVTDREIRQPLPVVQIVGQVERAAAAADTRQYRSPANNCAPDDDFAQAKAQRQLRGLPQATLQRLCQAGLKFTSGLPKT